MSFVVSVSVVCEPVRENDLAPLYMACVTDLFGRGNASTTPISDCLTPPHPQPTMGIW